ncbi:MAG: hypothetical protein Q4G33_02955 [bacterium]|nr:hypothetical protein [bacterium]
MKNNSFSVFGRVMNLLNVSTSAMAQSLHVDASLISKWRTGARSLTKNSPYFDDAARTLDENYSGDSHSLAILLHDFIPNEEYDASSDTLTLITQALSSSEDVFPQEYDMIFGSEKTSHMLCFGGSGGRQEGVKRALTYAEGLDSGREIIIIDSEEFYWLLEDDGFLIRFEDRIYRLLEMGFHAKFILHYSPSAENFRRFFEKISPVLFHRNAEWYYSAYYDESVMNVSMLAVNHSVMVLGIAVNGFDSTTMIFTDKPAIELHYRLINNIIERCTPIFCDFKPDELLSIVGNAAAFRKSSILYSFLPVPAFIAIRPSLLRPILEDNEVDDETAEKVMKLNHDFRLVVKSYNPNLGNSRDTFIQIFQLEKFTKRVKQGSFISRSLTNVCGKDIVITSQRHALALRHLVDTLLVNDNVRIVMASEKDYRYMPQINCWVKENGFVLQMDTKGFRACDESIAVSAAAIALAHCVHRVPPERKERNSIIEFLSELAEELEKSET